jgi:hypothetical protein
LRIARGDSSEARRPGRTGCERAGDGANGEAGQTDTLVVVRGETSTVCDSSGTRGLAYRIGWHNFKEETPGHGGKRTVGAGRMDDCTEKRRAGRGGR